MTKAAVLRAALEALEAGRKEEALGALVAAWRETRAPEIAALVDRLSPLVAPPLPPAKEKRRQDHAEWLAAARARDASRIAALLETLSVGTVSEVAERIAVLESWPADPRVADALARFVEAAPFPGEKAKALVWPRVLELLVSLGDRRSPGRLREAAAALDRRYGDFTRWLSGEAKRCADAIDASPARAPADPALLAAIESRLPGAAGGDDPRGRELLAKVLADPDDDAARLVLADHLSERGDPRGELIVLQMEIAARRATTSQARRADELIEAHYDEWVRDLAAILPRTPDASTRFDKGFLAAVRLGQREAPEEEWRKAVGHPLLATVKEVTVGGQVRFVPAVLASMPALEVVHAHTHAAISAFGRSAAPTRARTLALELRPTAREIERIAASPAWDALTSLQLRMLHPEEHGPGDDHGTLARSLLEGALGLRLSVVEVEIDDEEDAVNAAFAEWLDPRRAAPCEIRLSGLHSAGTLARRRLVLEGAAALAVLERCRPKDLDELEVAVSGLRPSRRRRIEELARQLGIPKTSVS